MINLITSLVPMVLNTVGSIVKDKKAKKEASTEFLNNDADLKKGISISSKRVMNVIGTPVLIVTGMTLLSTDPKYGVIVIGLGILYSVGLSYVTHISEK